MGVLLDYSLGDFGLSLDCIGLWDFFNINCSNLELVEFDLEIEFNGVIYVN